ncbi:hypothetical protein [Xenococcus sp. PCC 7305]|uniref:hypothetical protein n=1 Tax=Xenococcus sp. PCC 7305 TaxID=102125 RepID=UPI000592C50F|nr:hypothetical protein [Xenococcus sp. PCC 7305]
MMTEQEQKLNYEGAMLQQLIKNSERLAVIEQKISSIDKTLQSAQWLLATIAIGVLINIFSQPILGYLN